MNVTHSFTVNAKMLYGAAKHAANHLADNNTLRYVYLVYDKDDQVVSFYATDSFRLVTFSHDVVSSCDSVIIPVPLSAIRKAGKVGYTEAIVDFDEDTNDVAIEFYKKDSLESQIEFTEVSVYNRSQEELQKWIDSMDKMFKKAFEQEQGHNTKVCVNVNYMLDMFNLIKNVFGKNACPEVTVNDRLMPVLFGYKDTLIGSFEGILMPKRK